MLNDNMHEDLDEIESIKKFIKNNDAYFTQDLRDFRRGKNIATGAGPFSKVGRAWGEARANVTFNVMKKTIDSTCNAYLRDPFEFENLPEEAVSKINETLYLCLREACECGVSYFYICHTPEGKLKFKRFPCTDVIWTDDEAICIKKEKREPGDVSRNTIWTGFQSITIGANETSILTHFKKDKENGTVTITQLKDDQVQDSTTLQLDTLPLVQIRCKAHTLSDNETHYRGYYFEFEDLLNVINMNLSVSAEQMIVPNPWIVGESTIGSNQYREQYETPEPRPYYTYRDTMEVMDGEVKKVLQLNPPAPAPNKLDIPALNEHLQAMLTLIDSQTGMDLASENKGNETAAAVLTRNRAKEDALSEMLFNLNRSAKLIATIIQQYMAMLGTPLQDENGQELQIIVTDKLSETLRNKNIAELLIAIQQLTPMTKLAIMQTFGAPDPILQAVQADAQKAMEEEQDPEKLALTNQVQQLTMQITQMQSENKMADATHAAALIEAQKEAEIKTMQAKNELAIEQGRQEIEKLKLQLEWAKLEQKAEVEQTQLGMDAASKAIEVAKTAQAETIHSVI